MISKQSRSVFLMVSLVVGSFAIGGIVLGADKLRLWECTRCGAQRQDNNRPGGRDGGECPKSASKIHSGIERK